MLEGSILSILAWLILAAILVYALYRQYYSLYLEQYILIPPAPRFIHVRATFGVSPTILFSLIVSFILYFFLLSPTSLNSLLALIFSGICAFWLSEIFHNYVRMGVTPTERNGIRQYLDPDRDMFARWVLEQILIDEGLAGHVYGKLRFDSTSRIGSETIELKRDILLEALADTSKIEAWKNEYDAIIERFNNDEHYRLSKLKKYAMQLRQQGLVYLDVRPCIQQEAKRFVIEESLNESDGSLISTCRYPIEELREDDQIDLTKTRLLTQTETSPKIQVKQVNALVLQHQNYKKTRFANWLFNLLFFNLFLMMTASAIYQFFGDTPIGVASLTMLLAYFAFIDLFLGPISLTGANELFGINTGTFTLLLIVGIWFNRKAKWEYAQYATVAAFSILWIIFCIEYFSHVIPNAPSTIATALKNFALEIKKYPNFLPGAESLAGFAESMDSFAGDVRRIGTAFVTIPLFCFICWFFVQAIIETLYSSAANITYRGRIKIPRL